MTQTHHNFGMAGMRQGDDNSRRGSALVIVLASVMLLMILSLAFLTSVGTELQSSKMYANGSSQKLLTQSAVNIVIGQIRVATANASYCWASQPGMIRTYNTSGQAAAYYKLYSDDSMQGTGAFDHTQSANSVPANWYSQKGVYIDLNQPVSRSGVNYYPILDGDAADMATFSSSLDGSVRGIGPLTSSKPAIEGYWLTSSTPRDTTAINQAPMPVKWLYVLQNGQVISPDSSTGGTVTFNNAVTNPSSSNPIVGRMAFWTDDETCKININTASEGAFWDTPRTYTTQDYYMATRQPVQGEYQRYPGHPATVCLSTVLGLTNAKSTWLPESPLSNEDLYPVLPYTKKGGSTGGTATTSSATSALTRSVSRLYANVDELFFQGTLSSNVRQPNSSLLSTPSALNASALKKARFFLTANSQAPDVNVFNLPRISMWPITLSSGSALMTPYDKLISFCTTVNNHIFYFQRQDPTSPSVDLPTSGSSTGLGRNRQLIEYLRTLTSMPFPGFGTGTFATKYGDDRHQILVEMFDYIRSTNLIDTSTGTNSSYIYAKPFDSTSSSASYLGGQGQVVPIVDNGISATDTLSGSTTHPRGFGRFPTVQEAAMVFIGVEDKNTTSTLSVTYPGFTYSYPPVSTASSNIQRVQAGFFIQLFDPSQGSPFAYPWLDVQIDGLDSFQWSNDGTSYYSMNFTSSGTISKPYTKTFNSGQNLYGGMIDIRTLSYQRGNATSSNKYPFITPPTGASNSSTICPDMNGGFIYFKGGTAAVKLFALDKNGARVSTTPVQTLTMSFPAATIPLPKTYSNSSMMNLSSSNTILRSFYDATVLGRLNMNSNYVFIGAQDVVRAVVATPGDIRLIAARTDVPSSLFSTLTSSTTTASYSSDYFSSTATMSHMLRYGLVFPVHGCAGGKLVDVNYSLFMQQYTSSPASSNKNINDFGYYVSGGSTFYRCKDCSVPTFTGVSNSVAVADWDTGVGNSHDGPFINKSDEGDMGNGTNAPYFALDYALNLPPANFFSPNRMVPSPGVFGSLPTGVLANTPWQTLLFRPGPAGHKGLGSPSTTYPNTPPYTTLPDHLFLDLFTMPVVEPYAISTPLATAGRINMNYLIVPFTYIHRDTGLRAAMKAQMVTAIPSPTSTISAPTYKTYQNPNGSPTVANKTSAQTVRYPINADATLYQFQQRFSSGDIFRAASEICSVDIVPVDTTNSAPTIPVTRALMDAYWAKLPLTGDNVRERPYANLYPLLTTKSNTYTVHYRVQLLKQAVNTTDYSTWREGTDLVTGEQRGSQTIERYIDPSDTIPDYADSSVVSASNFPPSKPLSQYYKFRVISTRIFAP